MALSTDGPTEHASVTPEVTSEGNVDVPVQPGSAAELGDSPNIEDPGFEGKPDRVEYERTEEVPSLLGGGADSGKEELDSAPDQDEDDENLSPSPADGVAAGNDADNAVPATDSFQNLPENQPTPAIIAEPGNSPTEDPAVRVEIESILASLQDSLAHTHYISSRIDAVSNDTERLIKEVNGISFKYEQLTAEMESISSGANSKNMFSKAFLAISSVVLASLVIFQIYMFFSLINIQRLQNAAGSSVLENISSLNKKMADYDKNLTKALEKPAQQEHALPNPAAAEKTDNDAHGNKEAGSANATPVLERLNKLRNGLPEKKLIRKETGDWFVYNKKIQECISDVEIIEVLNQAYRKIGRQLTPTIPMPAFNALCILKPNGKGGTDVVMTKEFLP